MELHQSSLMSSSMYRDRGPDSATLGNTKLFILSFHFTKLHCIVVRETLTTQYPSSPSTFYLLCYSFLLREVQKLPVSGQATEASRGCLPMWETGGSLWSFCCLGARWGRWVGQLVLVLVLLPTSSNTSLNVIYKVPVL